LKKKPSDEVENLRPIGDTLERYGVIQLWRLSSYSNATWEILNKENLDFL
jgi:hypothetical protein